ncbi:sodium-coupled monocarboxylate transporter 2-like [Thrips palmi]|uniref:Sodium-coupled monocarboxylate transporter 2-like n=1 Tax=Thrips palmi TaxID=161013 RepID=A0A6P8Y6K4_THRPL|nr:sodium-coupled monocarboxylate transporter 2-like [Thrips palmi]
MAPAAAADLFGWVDYLVLALTLGISLLVGLYYGCCGSRQSTEGEYLLGNKEMKMTPVAISLIAGYISGITLLGTPGDIYSYGTQYYAIILGIFFMSFAINYLFLPVFTGLGVKSSYEYLQVRFRHRAVRTVSSFIFVFDEIITIPMYMYVPCLALEQVTSLHRMWTAPVMMLICILYTGLGGLKAVIWTDAIQMCIFCLSLVIIFVMGTVAVGGFGAVFTAAAEGGRLEIFNISPDPLQRTTLWGAVIGGFMYWTGFNSVNQTCVQRYLAVPNLKTARRAVWVFSAGVVCIISFCTYVGLLMYAYFRDCDPLAAGIVSTSDQLVAHFVMRVEGHLPGLPGLFMAGVVAAALSSISVSLNSTAGVVLDDFWRSYTSKRLNANQAAVFAKVTCAVFGFLCVGIMMAMQNVEYMIQVAMTLTGIAAGTQFGLFSLGMFNPWANYKGAIVGTVTSLVVVTWMSVGAQLMAMDGRINNPRLPSNVTGCVPAVEPTPQPTTDPTVLPLYRVSYLWTASIGWLLVMVLGSLVSLVTGPDRPDDLRPGVLSPPVAAWLRRRQQRRKEVLGVAEEPVVTGSTVTLAPRLEEKATRF